MARLTFACLLGAGGALLLLALGVPRAAGDGGGPSPQGAVIGSVGGEPVTALDLARYVFERDREAWKRAVDGLVDERIVDHEVRRLGLSLPPGTLERAIDAEVKAREKQVRTTYGERVTLADEIERGYGLDVADWRREVLAPRLRTQLLLQRVVRLDTRRRERVEVRVIVAGDEAKARSLLRRLREGADFSLLALQESIDPTAPAGGVLPAIARGDLVLPDVEDRLFRAAPGALVGPLEVTLDGKPTWHIYKVIGRVEPWTGTRAEILGRLEQDLHDHPLGRPEFERWRARMHRDFQVDIRRP